MKKLSIKGEFILYLIITIILFAILYFTHQYHNAVELILESLTFGIVVTAVIEILHYIIEYILNINKK